MPRKVPKSLLLVTFHMEYITPYIDIQLILQDPFHQLKKKLLEFSWVTVLCWFLLYSKVNQQYMYICPLFLGFPSHLGHHGALRRLPCAIQSRYISDAYSFWSILSTSGFKTPSTHSLSLIDMAGPFYIGLASCMKGIVHLFPSPACMFLLANWFLTQQLAVPRLRSANNMLNASLWNGLINLPW